MRRFWLESGWFQQVDGHRLPPVGLRRFRTYASHRLQLGARPFHCECAQHSANRFDLKVEKHPKYISQAITWQIAARPASTSNRQAQCLIQSAAYGREGQGPDLCQGDHPFRVIKPHFGYTKVRLRDWPRMLRRS